MRSMRLAALQKQSCTCSRSPTCSDVCASNSLHAADSLPATSDLVANRDLVLVSACIVPPAPSIISFHIKDLDRSATLISEYLFPISVYSFRPSLSFTRITRDRLHRVLNTSLTISNPPRMRFTILGLSLAFCTAALALPSILEPRIRPCNGFTRPTSCPAGWFRDVSSRLSHFPS